MMEKLILIVNNLKEGPLRALVNKRMSEFSDLGKRNSNEIFKELCFCFLTANFQAQRSIQMQNSIGDGFLNWPEGKLAETLQDLGHRFPNARAKFIIEARPYKDNIKETITSFPTEIEMRDWIVKNIKGLGMKESSHFLRNIGFKNFAIIDFHIVDLLARHALIEQPKSRSLTPKKYLEIENVLRELANKTNSNLGELDLYLWYEETGTILK
ncbi:MAG: N-glycosylase/DNA lyase [Nanoarchaeota archaeon]|nr:N-glycosylase/DNA lyase [Nanoarchaeota archaeon]